MARCLLLSLAALGSALVLHGAYIPAKAQLAQVLLERAWHAARLGAASPRAWPWADHTPVARLLSEQHGVDLLVLSGAQGNTLAFAPGHVDGTSLPGAAGNAAVGGHRDTHFQFLQHVAVGEALVVQTRDGERVAYRVVETAVVDEHDTRALAQMPGRALTLITCWPFDAVVAGGPLRYVVRAVEADDAA